MGCGRIRPQAELRRFAADAEGRVVPDDERRLASRGAYVCDEDCLAEATRRRAWGRAFRRAVTPPGTG
ncbi:MAG TPA: YlxR family protein [Solirubrobacteraceae bacterium]